MMYMYNLSNLEPKFKNFLHAVNISPVSLRNYLSDVRHFFGWVISKYIPGANINSENNISSISPQIIEEYKTDHVKSSLPVKTINRRLSALRKFFFFLQKEGLLKNNPAKVVKNVSLLKKLQTKRRSEDVRFEHLPTGRQESPRENAPNAVSVYEKRNIELFLAKFFKHFSVIFLVIFSLVIFSFSLLNKQENLTPIVQATPTSKRYLAFNGRLTDNLGNPITTKTDVVFNLYNASSNGKILFTANCFGQDYAITPEVNGNFKVLLGSDCGGNGIPSSIFSDNPEVYLGIKVGSDKEMSPRQPIANVNYAINSDRLQGLPIGTSASTIPFIDSTGNLLITAPSPSVKSTSGTFSLSAQALIISTAAGFSGDIKLSPDIGGNTFITSGDLVLGTIYPTAKLDVEGTASISGNLTFRGFLNKINILNGAGLIFQTSSDGDAGLMSRLSIANSGEIGINSSAQTGLQIKLGNNSSNPDNNDQFINFLRGDSMSIGKIIGNGSGGITYSTTGSDFAEYFIKDEYVNFAEGDVVSIDSDSKTVSKSKKDYDAKIIGVVSNHPGFAGGEPASNKVLVALVGQVKVKISPNSASIKTGDFLTTSQDEGLAMKAEKAGFTLGKALEDWDRQNSKKSILLYLNLTWFDPYVYNGKLPPSDNEKIVSPIAETDRVETNEIKAKEGNLILNLSNNTQDRTDAVGEFAEGEGKTASVNKDKGPLAKLIIKGLEGKTVVQIDAAGNASFSGQLAADSLEVKNNATISGLLSAGEASLSGKLVAKEIEAENIKVIEDRLNVIASEAKQSQLNGIATSSTSSPPRNNNELNNQINEIQKLLSQIKNQPLPNPTYYQNLDNNQQLTINNQAVEQLTVTGSSNLYNLSVTGSGTIGSLLIENNSILSLAWDLKLSALSTIRLFDDAVIISKDGTIKTKGKIIAQDGIKTNKIEPLTPTDKVTINNLAINNLAISDKYIFDENSPSTPTIETKTASAGNGIIPPESLEVIIYNDSLENSSLIYLTPTSPSPTILTLAQKNTCDRTSAVSSYAKASEDKEEEDGLAHRSFSEDGKTAEVEKNLGCKSYFKVTLDRPVDYTVSFNWLIIN